MYIKFEGNLEKVGSYWAVSVPTLDVYSQGKSKKDALSMIQEAIELLVDQPHFSVTLTPLSQGHFVVHATKSEHDRYLMALMLKNQRAKYGLSLTQVAERLGISKNAYAQYEHARAIPSIAKVEEFVHAMSNHHVHVVLGVVGEALAA